jgi:hypothetical protein
MLAERGNFLCGEIIHRISECEAEKNFGNASLIFFF